jgi:hypothetical protein
MSVTCDPEPLDGFYARCSLTWAHPGHLLTLLAQRIIGYFGDIQGVHPLQIELHPQGLGIDLNYDCRPAISQGSWTRSPAYSEEMHTLGLLQGFLAPEPLRPGILPFRLQDIPIKLHLVSLQLSHHPRRRFRPQSPAGQCNGRRLAVA